MSSVVVLDASTTNVTVDVTEETGGTTTVTVPVTEVVTATTPGPQGPASTYAGLPPRSATLYSPLEGDSVTLFKTTAPTTISSVVGVLSGGELRYELRYSSNRSLSGTAITASTLLTNTTTGSAATLNTPSIPSDSYVWVNILDVTGTVSEFNLSISF